MNRSIVHEIYLKRQCTNTGVCQAASLYLVLAYNFSFPPFFPYPHSLLHFNLQKFRASLTYQPPSFILPSTRFYTARMGDQANNANNTIAPAAIDDTVTRNLVRTRTNPNQCICGWYILYSSVCHHEFTKVKRMCGQTTATSGVTCFCRTPAPRNIVPVEVNLRCKDC